MAEDINILPPQAAGEQGGAPQPQKPPRLTRFVKIKTGKAAAMAFFFSFIYLMYWCGKQWGAVKKSDPRYKNIWPFWRGFFFFIYMIPLGKLIDSQTEFGGKKCQISAWFVLLIPLSFLLPDGIGGGGIVAAVPTGIMQAAINDLEPEEEPFQRGITLGDCVVLAVALLFVGLAVLGGMQDAKDKCFLDYTVAGNVYKNKCLGVNFNLPDGVKSMAGTDSDDETIVVFFPSRYNDVNAADQKLGIQLTDLTPAASEDEIRKYFASTGEKFVKYQKFTLDGHDAMRYSWVNKDGMYNDKVVFEHGGKTMNFLYWDKAGTPQMLEDVLKTVKFTTPR